MSYRKITVDNKEYEYTIGKSFTKIKEVGLFFNEQIGDRIQDREENDKFVVTPYNVANAIKGIYSPRSVQRCTHGVVTHETVEDPYSLEVLDEVHQLINCKKCIAQSYDEI